MISLYQQAPTSLREMDFETREDNDGVRLSWTSLPKSKLQHQRNVIPMGALYTPLNNKTSISVLDQNCIISCRTCRAVLNPYSPINNSLWTCQICNSSNQLPAMVDSEGQPCYPPNLNPELTTVEYKTGRSSALPPIFFMLSIPYLKMMILKVLSNNLKRV